MRLAVIVPFLNEGLYLEGFLSSLERQTRPPDRLLLVDDGSEDASPDIASAFADGHPYASALRRPSRPPEDDRLAGAHEYQAFQWALGHLDGDCDVVAKLDADLELPPKSLATIEARLDSDPQLGIAGAYLSVRGRRGATVREHSPPYHVRGATKFYRRACLRDISPVPAILGWDTIDEAKARMLGWSTASFEVPGGDPIHLRPTGAADGSLRAFWRWGACAYAAGFHPLWVLLGAARRVAIRPPVIGGGAYLTGWVLAALRRPPRAEPRVRSYLRHEQLQRLRGNARVNRRHEEALSP
ncbi:MAG: glycosyltransferase family 2 protein [Actinomycetota bacterium]|nr:glycosyltransferase family 2 protein [Actinomycetota bacterium]